MESIKRKERKPRKGFLARTFKFFTRIFGSNDEKLKNISADLIDIFTDDNPHNGLQVKDYLKDHAEFIVLTALEVSQDKLADMIKGAFDNPKEERAFIINAGKLKRRLRARTQKTNQSSL